MSIFLLIVGVILFIGLVVAHEFGHFIAARRNGVEIEEFGIGFPPKIWSREVDTGKSKFLFTINALPLGGFVRLKGENDEANEPGSFGAASLSTKVKIMVAGVTMNLIVALGLFTLLALVGMPKIIDNQFTVASDTKISKEIAITALKVEPNQPAERAGLKKNDGVVSVAGTPIAKSEQIGQIAKQNAGKTVPVVVERNGNHQTLQVEPTKYCVGVGYHLK